MATTEKSRSDEWKDKYFKALNELDQHERVVADKVGRLSRDLLALLERFRGTAPAFDQDLTALARDQHLHEDAAQTRLRGLVSALERALPATGAPAVATTAASTPPVAATSPAAASAAPAAAAGASDPLAALRALLDHITAPAPLQAALAALRQRVAAGSALDLDLIAAIAAQLSRILHGAGDADTRHARDVLQSLLDHLSLPAAAQARIGAITPKLQQAEDEATLKALACEVADFVVEYVAELHAEVAGLGSFLQVVKARLSEITGFIDLEQHERKAAGSAREALTRSVKHNLERMRGNVDKAADIDALKQQIQQHIAIIDGSLSAFVKDEDARSARSETQHEALSRQLEALGSETDKLRKELAEAQSLATRDTLTSLPNRLAYNERMHSEHARFERSGRELSLVVIDIDRFKSINDTWGHQAGDRVLKHVAREIKSQVRAQDFCARYGGEEFVLILPETGRAGALKLADNLRRHIESCQFKYKDAPVTVTISCGIAELQHGEASGVAFERADHCLYAAKQNGRNRCEVAA